MMCNSEARNIIISNIKGRRNVVESVEKMKSSKNNF